MKRLIGTIPVILLFIVYIFFFHDSSINLIYNLLIVGYVSGALLVSLFIRNNDASKGALIMGLGIVSVGPIQTLNITEQVVGIVPFLLGGLWLQISFSYVKNFKGLNLTLSDINQTFLYGTWVAATSVVSVSILIYYPTEMFLSKTIALIGTFLWIIYMAFSIAAIQHLLYSKPKRKEIHGSILLTTVSTQSIVIGLEWTLNLIVYVELILISLGILFYIIGIAFLISRYLRNDWSLIEDWKNTNCIVHGALSISGVAWINSITTPSLTAVYWNIVVVLFLIIEVVELVRAVQRVKVLGLYDGLGVYHPSQWARIFTFGMLYYFTLIQIPVTNGSAVLQNILLSSLGPAIVILTILQLLIMGYPFFIRNKVKSAG